MRYKIVRESSSGHCCFEATVVDTEKLNSIGYYDNLCECLDEKDAITICNVLNGGPHEFTEDDKPAEVNI